MTFKQTTRYRPREGEPAERSYLYEVCGECGALYGEHKGRSGDVCPRDWPLGAAAAREALHDAAEREGDPPVVPGAVTRLPTDAAERKAVPIYSGVLRYFPDALAAVAECSKKGNDQHNPGKPLHWDRSKSGDELDALTRHLVEAGTVDTDGVRHSTKVAWRALANLQKEIEREREAQEQRAWKT